MWLAYGLLYKYLIVVFNNQRFSLEEDTNQGSQIHEDTAKEADHALGQYY